MSNIVILTGSTRRGGNTDALAGAFAKGALSTGTNNVEIISVADINVSPCTGCNSCFESPAGRCAIDDDMQSICAKLAYADILVIASPVYFYGISAQLKGLIDRLHNPVRNSFRIKKLALLLVAGAQLPEVFDSILMQYDLTLKFFGLEDGGKVLVRGVRHMGDIEGNPALDDAFRLGAQIHIKEN